MPKFRKSFVVKDQSVPTSKPEEVFQAINDAIEGGRPGAYIGKLLQGSFIYPGLINKYKDCRHPPNHYETYNVRPVLEALFFERNDLFLDLVLLLIEKSDETLYQAFIDSLKDTELSAEMLFTFNQAMKDDIKKNLESMDDHAQQNYNNHDFLLYHSKYLGTLVFIPTLVDKLNSAAPTEEPTLLLRNKFQKLAFKLDFLQLLHSEDSEAAERRSACGYNPANTEEDLWGYKTSRALNAISPLLFGVPFLINKVTTGNLFFFSRTTTEKKIRDVQAATGLPRRGIRFGSGD